MIVKLPLMKFFAPLLVIALSLVATFDASAQCRSFTKKNCLTELEGYVQNDNYNSAVLIPGDEAELMLTFLAGTDYRLLVCSHPVLGEVQFEVLDSKGKALFNSAKAGGRNQVDFRVEKSQQLMVHVYVPESEAAILHEGCVTILVGSK